VVAQFSDAHLSHLAHCITRDTASTSFIFAEASDRPQYTFGTPEGHAVKLGESGEVIGITIVNAKWLLERDGKITVTVPNLIETNADDLAAALATA
jgi:uncharacterized protein YuzE